MTILRPNYEKKERIWRGVCLVGGVSLLLTLLPTAIIYSNLVEVRYETKQLEKTLNSERVKNAELKQRYIQAVGSLKAEEMAIQKGLVEENNPRWIFASL